MSNFDHLFDNLDALINAAIAREKLFLDLGEMSDRVRAKFEEFSSENEKREAESRKVKVADKLALIKSAMELGLTEEGVFKLFYSVYPPYNINNQTNAVLDAIRSFFPSLLKMSQQGPFPDFEDFVDPVASEEDIIDQEEEADVSESSP